MSVAEGLCPPHLLLRDRGVFCDLVSLMKKSTAVQLVAMCWQSLPSSPVPLSRYVFFEFLQQQQGRGRNDQQLQQGCELFLVFEGFGAAVARSSGGSGHGSLAERFM